MTTFSESDIREGFFPFLFPNNAVTAFNTFDRDGNGFIGASDIHATYMSISENLSDDEVLSLLFFFARIILLPSSTGRSTS